MKRDDPRHGTYAGAQAHQKEGKRLCRPCLDAKAAYMRERRKVDDSYKAQNAARSRALWRLADLYREEYERLYVEERTAQHVERMRGRAS